MFRAVVTDLDGTLLRSDGEISDYTVQTLARAAAQGVTVILCTGRMYDSLKFILPRLPFCRYAVTNMGAELYDTKTGTLLESIPLEQSYMQTVVAYGLARGVHMNLYIDNVLYTNSLDRYAEQYFRHTSTMAKLVEGDVQAFVRGKDLAKIAFIGEEDDIAAHGKELRRLLGGKINICASWKTYVECSSLRAQKHLMLARLLDRLSLQKEEALLFGDSGNDVTMLASGGFSVCVANGWDEAKAAARLICEENDADGVARTVARLILEEGAQKAWQNCP